MYTHHCFDKYGQCPYYDVCTLEDIKVRHRLLMSEAYQDVTWSPLV
jgi:hypothetical protein